MTSADVTLQQAADQLGVHYMTAYRYVKLGLLYAEKRGGAWMITADDLDAFQGKGSDDRAHAGDNGTGAEGRSDRVSATRSGAIEPGTTGTGPCELEDALTAGDEAAAWRLVQAAIADAGDPIDVHFDLLSPALASIGQRWADGELSIAAEHKASAIATRVIARLATELTAPGRRRGTVIVGAAPGDVHSIPSAMFADVIRSFGVNVVDLGGSPDLDSFVEAVRRHPEAVVVVSLTGPGHEAAVKTVVGALRDQVADLPIGVGGGAVACAADASGLGADLWHDDHRTAAKLIAEAAARRASTVRSAS